MPGRVTAGILDAIFWRKIAPRGPTRRADAWKVWARARSRAVGRKSAYGFGMFGGRARSVPPPYAEPRALPDHHPVLLDDGGATAGER